MKQSGSADLALMGGYIPGWLFERMVKMSEGIVEAILVEYGHQTFLTKLSDPFWFQSFGAVIGMDWNSSGVTTAVLRALERSLNPLANELGLYVCGGKGKHSLQTPAQLERIGDATGLDGLQLARASKLVAKVDNTAVQDGFQLYIHSFLLSKDGDWTVVQQGMQGKAKSARRYHWHSGDVESFVNEPHSAVCGTNQGEILNLVAEKAKETRSGILDITQEHPEKNLKEIRKMILPGKKGIRPQDVNLKRLSGILQVAHEQQSKNFEDLLLLKGMGPRTLQSLTLVSEVIHGTPSRFSDPARFAFAHGSKGGKPFPVPTHVYDETISTLRKAVDLAKIGQTDKQKAIQKLSKMAQVAEKDAKTDRSVDELLEQERRDAWKYGGRTMKGFVEPPEDRQLGLFDQEN
ncbi:MAG: DUF763 domain-containing protein [Bacteroidota bacterium]